MDPDESPFSRFGRTLWAALAYITTSVVRFLRTETDTAGIDDPSSHEEDDATKETVTQKHRPEHSDRGETETERAVCSTVADVHNRQHTIPWEKCEVTVTDHHEQETNTSRVQYSKFGQRNTEFKSEKPKQVSFEKRDDLKQESAAEDVEMQIQIQGSSANEDHDREIMDITVSRKEHINDHITETDALIKKVDDPLGTKLINLDMDVCTAAGNSGIVDESGPHGSGLAVSGVKVQDEKMMVQEVDHGNDLEAEAPLSRLIDTNITALNITLTEQTPPKPYTSDANQEWPMSDAIDKDEEHTPQSTPTSIDQEEEIHRLTHRLVEAVVMSSVEFVNNELKTRESHEEDRVQTSMLDLTSQDQVHGAYDLEEQQQPTAYRPDERMTVWYDGETEGGTELAENEREGCQEEGGQEEERLGDERPEARAHDKQLWRSTEEEVEEQEEEETKSQEAEEGMEDLITENKNHEAQDPDLEEVAEQEVCCSTDQNIHEEEEQAQLQATEGVISDSDQLYEKAELLVEEEVTELESDSVDGTTVDAMDDKRLSEEEAENSFEEDYADGLTEERRSMEDAGLMPQLSCEDAGVMPQDSLITAEPVPVTGMAQAIDEGLPQVGQYSHEMNANAEEMIDGAIEVTDTSLGAGVEEPVGWKAEPQRDERMDEGEEEEEEEEEEEIDTEEEERERDEFEGLRPAEESEDEGVSIDPEDTEVQEAQEGWHSEEGEADFTDGFTSPITEASDALLYEAEIPESELIETGTDASLLREDAELTTTETGISLACRFRDKEHDMQWESQMASQESDIAAGSGYTESDHTSFILSTTATDGDAAMADYELMPGSSEVGLQQDALGQMTLDNSDTERELLEDLSESFESKLRQQEEAELKIKRQLSNESKPLDEGGSELKVKCLTTTALASDQEESAESDIKPTVHIMSGSESELVDMPKQSSTLITCSVDPKAELTEVAEEQVGELDNEVTEAITNTDPQIDMEINPLHSQAGSEEEQLDKVTAEPSIHTDLQTNREINLRHSESALEEVAQTSWWDPSEEHEDDNIDSSERTVSVKRASEEGGCITETSSTAGIMLMETDPESNMLIETDTESNMLIEIDSVSNFLLSETAETLAERSLNPTQVMSKGGETMTASQTQADSDRLSPDHQISTPEAEPEESQESERRYGEGVAEDLSENQMQELCERGSMSSYEDKEHRVTWEESKAEGSHQMWEATESETKILEDEIGDERRSVTDKNETEFDEAEGERDGITETNPDNMEEGEPKAIQEAVGDEHEADAQQMAATQVESEETIIDGRMMLKRKLENAEAEDEQDLAGGQLPTEGSTPQVSSLDFSIQKSRIAVKNPQVRPPKDPRTLLNLPSLEPTPRPQQEPLPGHPDKKPPAFGVPLGGVGVMGVKLPGLGAGFPVLRKTNRGPKEEEKSESSSVQEKTETEKTQTEDAAEDVQTQSKPKWTPPKHAIGMGNPFMMAELKGKLKKPAAE